MVHHFLHDRACLLLRKDPFVVLIPEVTGDLSGGHDVGRVFHPDAEGGEDAVCVGAHQVTHNARVDAAAEEETWEVCVDGWDGWMDGWRREERSGGACI